MELYELHGKKVTDLSSLNIKWFCFRFCLVIVVSLFAYVHFLSED